MSWHHVVLRSCNQLYLDNRVTKVIVSSQSISEPGSPPELYSTESAGPEYAYVDSPEMYSGEYTGVDYAPEGSPEPYMYSTEYPMAESVSVVTPAKKRTIENTSIDHTFFSKWFATVPMTSAPEKSMPPEVPSLNGTFPPMAHYIFVPTPKSYPNKSRRSKKLLDFSIPLILQTSNISVKVPVNWQVGPKEAPAAVQIGCVFMVGVAAVVGVVFLLDGSLIVSQILMAWTNMTNGHFLYIRRNIVHVHDK